MGKRPQTHVTGDLGVNKVETVCLSLGWACDRVQSDYGEDLVVQTSLDGKIDPFRTLLQIKATSNSKRFHSQHFGLSILLPRDTILKWLRNREPVIVILWDTSLNRGWWALPQSQLELYDVMLKNKKTERIKFTANSKFNQDTAYALGWSLRLEYYCERLFAAYRRDSLHCQEGRKGNAGKKYKSDVPLVVFELCNKVGLMTSTGWSQKFMRGYKRLNEIFSQEYKDFSTERIKRMTVTFLVLGMLDEKCPGIGVPPSLLEACTGFVPAIDREIEKRKRLGTGKSACEKTKKRPKISSRRRRKPRGAGEASPKTS